MACMCGDICCPSCGPAQGNFRCPSCRAWSSDGCECTPLEIAAAEERERLAETELAEELKAEAAFEEEMHQQYLKNPRY